MSETDMALSDGDLSRIGQYVRAELPRWLNELAPWGANVQLLERMVRVEEELKAQREVLLAHVQASDRRFADVNSRFDDVNSRFDDVNSRFDDVNRRFEDVNHRFEDNSRRHTATQWFVGVGFTVLAVMMSLYQFLA